jgi:hypothetical protein
MPSPNNLEYIQHMDTIAAHAIERLDTALTAETSTESIRSTRKLLPPTPGAFLVYRLSIALHEARSPAPSSEAIRWFTLGAAAHQLALDELH